MLLKVAGVFPAAEVDVGLSVAAFGISESSVGPYVSSCLDH